MIGLVCLSTHVVYGSLVFSTSSMKEYGNATEKLVVYTDVPGHDTLINGRSSRAKSDIYEIRVRSAATSNEWVQCFANMTYNRAEEMPNIKNDNGKNRGSVKQAYQRHTGGWTHTYANIEMSENSPVEVEIRKIGNTPLNSSTGIVKSAVHPAQKVMSGSQRDQDGRVYFTINKPGQLVIDINGQMDDHNAAFPSSTPGGAMKGSANVHAVSLFANPIMQKPAMMGPGIRFVTAGIMPATDTNYTTMVFGPGVHNIGPAFGIHPGKSYYIPGDALLYGSLSNAGSPKAGTRSRGDSINIYGYGTLCGIKIPHYEYNQNNESYPEYNALKGLKEAGDKGIRIEDAVDLKITGITIVDPANFNTHIVGLKKRKNDTSKISWVKAISWRANGDGFGGRFTLEDCFVRAADDATYVVGDRRRCTFWKDSNANIFRFIGNIGGTIEDCDVLYNRLREPRGGLGWVFAFDSYEGIKPKVVPVNVTVRNIRLHDKRSNMRVFGLNAAESYTGLTFENISAYLPLNGKKSEVKGHETARWETPGLFKNITFQNPTNGTPPVLVDKNNFSTYFITNEFVDKRIFE
jgi:hypothetical protein